jgi:quercetin dioxygenase-like cupin family protein
MDNEKIRHEIRANIENKKQFTGIVREYALSQHETMKLELDKYNEYLDGVLIKDFTSKELQQIGITVLHVLVNKDIEFTLHIHEEQNQMVTVLAGKIIDLENTIIFNPGEGFFVKKNLPHRLKYTAGSELTIVYMPALRQVKS